MGYSGHEVTEQVAEQVLKDDDCRMEQCQSPILCL